MDRFGANSLDDVLAGIAVGGTDPDGVSEYVVGALSVRRRNMRLLGAAAVALVLAAGGSALALTGGEDPEEVVAAADESDPSGDERSEGESESGSGSVVTAVPTTALPVPTTVPAIAGVTAAPFRAGSSGNLPSGGGSGLPTPGPASTVAPTTVPATTAPAVPTDQALVTDPLVVRAVADDGSIDAGVRVAVMLSWRDLDLPAGVAASFSISTDDPGALVHRAIQTLEGACTGGSGSSGIVGDTLRFATPGTRVVAVDISTCGGEIHRVETTVQVGAPVWTPDPGTAARAVIATVPAGVDPEAGTWTFTDGAAIVIPDPNVSMTRHGLPATVLVLPDEVAGTIAFTSDTCSYSAATSDVAGVAGQEFGLLDLSGATCT